MKKFLVALMVAVSAASMVPEAEAKRLGGGGSFGRQSQGISRQTPMQSPNQATNPSQAQPGAPAAAPQSMPAKPASPWRNILGGALLGLGLGALLSHLGIGGTLASIISTVLMIALLALAVMFVIRLVRGKNGARSAHDAHGARPAYAGGNPAMRTPEIGSRLEPQAQPAAFRGEPTVGGSAVNVPADFDTQSFLRHSKTYFIRLQAAWDRADINDIREFTAPELFAELRLQLQERGVSTHTDVVSLDADLLALDKVGDEYHASVKFSGMIKEAESAPAEPFAEVWNLNKPVSGQGGWVLAGIQQLS